MDKKDDVSFLIWHLQFILNLVSLRKKYLVNKKLHNLQGVQFEIYLKLGKKNKLLHLIMQILNVTTPQ